MAIISCPYCGHRISDKAAACSKCGGDLTGNTPEQLAAIERDKKYRKMQSLMNQSMLAMVLFLGGFGILYWWQPANHSYNQYASNGAIALGFCWYVITRARIILLKRK
ncbi:hypothetical protein WG68_18065 [Arsukibacterium ikkense]|uniref:Zinc-ribbon domain-containing protein n=1 Tax=Arsukibacterium ikkense TaxID=336831 RepID=A0A0M2V006_9GAMM|nr:zinc ribbon domain-containing protein [Arsukibacterium ikkense]KKO43921.1 hypothetical protein WG68_18065 [Arsukibacterium ikkense]